MVFFSFKYPNLKSAIAEIKASLFLLLFAFLLKPNKLHKKADRSSSDISDVISNTTLEYCLVLNNSAAFNSNFWIDPIGKFRQTASSN